MRLVSDCSYDFALWPPPDSHGIIQQQVEAYRTSLPSPDPSWPVGVRVVMGDLHEHLFDAGLRIKDVMQRCGTCNHNISSRFALFVGAGPKAYTIAHRLELAKRLL